MIFSSNSKNNNKLTKSKKLYFIKLICKKEEFNFLTSDAKQTFI